MLSYVNFCFLLTMIATKRFLLVSFYYHLVSPLWMMIFSQGLKRFLFDSNRAVSGADLQATVEAAERRRVLFQQAPVDLALLWRWFQVIKACRKGIQIQFNFETVSKVRYIKHVKLFIHVYQQLIVFGSIQNLAWPYMFYKLLLNHL